MIDCTLVTCEKVPHLDPDDRSLLGAIRTLGLSVSVAVWSDPTVDWSSSRLCVLRSTWDYYSRHDDFIAWVERAAKVTTIRNDPYLVRWNAHKSYISDLQQAHVPVVPTYWALLGSSPCLTELVELRGWRDVVIKPARGAAAHDVMLVRNERGDYIRGQAHLDHLSSKGDLLVQPYLNSVATYGERSLVFFQGRFSHAVVKKPFDTVLAVGNARSVATEPSTKELEIATLATRAIPRPWLYARVDLLRDDESAPVVSEMELIEPALYLGAHDLAPALFASAIERELCGSRTTVPTSIT
jgi:glutathione synthase/RimK-type ligase-like ATP-grasp enzyme